MLALNHNPDYNRVEVFLNDDDDVRLFLGELTKQSYSFTESPARIWGREQQLNITENCQLSDKGELAMDQIQLGYFYCLVPDVIDNGFYDWYCAERPNHQYFLGKEMCVAYFLKF